jgi:hypothetical protein
LAVGPVSRTGTSGGVVVRTLGLLFMLPASLLAACEDAPLPDAESSEVLQTRWRDSREVLTIRRRPDGLQEIDLSQRVQHRALAVVSADAGVRRACSTSPDLSHVGTPPREAEEAEPAQVQ